MKTRLKCLITVYCVGFFGKAIAQSYTGCVITGVDYAVRTDFPVYDTPAWNTESYAASGCQPSGATNSVSIYQNSSSSGNIGDRCYNISPNPSNIKNCKVTVMGIGRCGYITNIDFIACDLDTFCGIILVFSGVFGIWRVRSSKI